METAGLGVHLNVYVSLFFFLQIVTIMRDCFHTETSVAIITCPFLHIFLNGTTQLFKLNRFVLKFNHKLFIGLE